MYNMIKKFLSLECITHAILLGIISGIATSLLLLNGTMFLFTVFVTPIFGVIFGIITAPFFIYYSNFTKKSKKIKSFIFWVIASGISGWLAVWITFWLGGVKGVDLFTTFGAFALGGIFGVILLLLSFPNIFDIELSRLWRFVIAGGGVPVIILATLFVFEGNVDVMVGGMGLSPGPVFIPLFILWQTAVVVLFSLDIKKK